MLDSALAQFIAGLERSEISIATKALEESMEREGNVLRVPMGVNKSEIIELSNVLYIFQPKNKYAEIVLFNGRKMSYPTFAEEDLKDYLESKYKNFKYLNTNLLVNMDKIKVYHSYLNLVYFENNISCVINQTAMKSIVKNVVGKQHDLYLNNGTKGLISEYAPIR